ncbi:MAG: efflux RND transporter periplasmic adaptor subunit [Devosia sp.]|nr:efflux RND transporter periplasmic adaptor subunit [Devosia sp.]
MKTRTYQLALAVALAVCLALAVALVVVLRNAHPAVPAPAAQDSVVARGPATGTPAATNAAEAAEPALTTIQLSPQRLQQIGVTSAAVAFKDVSQQIAAPGNVDIDEQRLSTVQTRFAGWIQNVFANATYQYVRKGQRLFTIYSPDIVSGQQEYLLARKNQSTFAHDAHGMAAQESGWLMQAAEERLRQFGVPADTIADLQKTGQVQRDIAVNAPVSGYITERNALPNAYVQPDTKLYTIADLSTVWVYANVSQSDVGRLKPGSSAQVTVDAYPGRTFSGRIDQILPQVDMTTRTVRVRLVFSNPGVILKPGMYVNVALSVPLGRQLVVPSSAVLQSGSRAIAFLDHGEGNLEPRVIQTGPALDGSVVVLSGLKAGDKVVTSANFLVDSEAQLQSAFSGSAPAAPPAASTAAGNAPASQLRINFTTQPATPQKGANTVRIKLTDEHGAPVAGAQPTVVFFMPAMPEMGMAAQRSVTKLADKGNGLYEGILTLDSGGSFKVTITVQRNGQTVATQQLSVSAAGGM